MLSTINLTLPKMSWELCAIAQGSAEAQHKDMMANGFWEGHIGRDRHVLGFDVRVFGRWRSVSSRRSSSVSCAGEGGTVPGGDLNSGSVGLRVEEFVALVITHTWTETCLKPLSEWPPPCLHLCKSYGVAPCRSTFIALFATIRYSFLRCLEPSMI
jgi:hypothetical protein